MDRRGRAAARHASHLQQNPCHCEPVRTLVWQSVPLLHRTSNLCVGAGFYPARSAAPSQLSSVGRHPCVPPPDRHCTSNGGAHWPRPTGAGHGGGVGKTPVRRGACVPRRWGCRACRAAAHMGAALQEITGRVRQIGRGRTPPLRIGWRCGAKGVRIATSLRSSQ